VVQRHDRIESKEVHLKPDELQSYLYHSIPITQAMGVEVRQCGAKKVVLFAPLAPNINHRETVFGGSASTLAILSAWALLQTALSREAIAARLVIQNNTMSYDKPINSDFYAVCRFEDASAWERFKATLQRRKRARITVTSVLECEGEPVANFEGQFVALQPQID
jgi:thioesterase domain-containing protein